MGPVPTRVGRRSFQKARLEAARKVARKANPRWFPQAIKLVVNQFTGEQEWNDRLYGALTEDDWGPAYGRTSELLHARSPYADAERMKRTTDVAGNGKAMSELLGALAILLANHVIEFPGDEYWTWAQIEGSDGKPWAGGFGYDPEDWRREMLPPHGQ